MKKQRVLLAVPLYYYWDHDVWTEFRFCLSGPTIVNEEIDREKFEVDFIDFDAMAVKQYHNISSTSPDDFVTMMNEYRAIVEDGNYSYILFSFPLMHEMQYTDLAVMMMYYVTERSETTVYLGGLSLRNSRLRYQQDVLLNLPDFKPYFNFENYNFEKSHLIPVTGPSMVPDFIPADVWNKINKKDSEIKSYLTLDGQIRRGYYYDCITRKLNYLPNNLSDFRYSYAELFEKYPEVKVPNKSKIIQMAELKLSDGCPYNCAFCEISGRDRGSHRGKYVKMDSQSMIDVVQSYVDKGFNSFFFLDRTSSVWPEEFFHEIIRRNLKISWAGSFNLKNKDLDYWKMIYEAGGRVIDVGLESVSNPMLIKINKGFTSADAQQFMDDAHSAGLFVSGNFIFGMPGETIEDLKFTTNFIEKNVLDMKLNSCSSNGFIMMYDSTFYTEAEKYDCKILDRDARDCRYIETSGPLSHMTYEELENYKETLNTMIKSNLFHKKLQLPFNCSYQLLFALYDIYNDKEKVVKHFQRIIK